MVGDLEVFSLHDGFVEGALDPGMVKNTDVGSIKAAFKAAGLSEERYTNTFTTTAVKTGGKLVLIDTGFGANGPPTTGKMLDNMKAAGLDPASVATVVISHFHPDHIQGLWVKETSAQVFPNAEILMPEVEYKFWTDPALIDKLPEARRGVVRRLQATFPTWKNIKQYADGAELAPGIRAIATPGHTSGHMSFLVSSGTQQLFVQSDVTGVPYLFVKNPGWYSVFDTDGPMAEATRRKFFDRVIAEKGMIAGYHFNFPNVGTLAKDGTGYAFSPLKA